MVAVTSASSACSATRVRRSATGSVTACIIRQNAASSIQAGISWSRPTPASSRAQRITRPPARSITSRTRTVFPAHGCQA
jgi:hypothetical protein